MSGHRRVLSNSVDQNSCKIPIVPRLTKSDAMTNFQQQLIYIGIDLKKDVNYLRSSLTGYLPRDLTTCFGVHSKSKGKITEVRTEAKSFFGEKTEVELSISQDTVARKTLTQYKRNKERKKERNKQRKRNPTGNHDLTAN